MRCSAPRILVAVLTAIVLGALGRAPAQGQGAGESEHPWVLEGDSLWGSRDQGTEIVNPRIRHEELRIRALHGRLSADRQTLVLIDDVRIEDTTRVVVSEQGVYRRAQRVLDLVGNVVGRGPEGDFRADELTYDRATGRMELRGRPEVSDSGRVVWADRIRWDNTSSRAEADGHVRILLRADSTWVNGDHADYDRSTGEIVMVGNPWLFRAGPDSTQDLRVHADTLRMNEFSRQGAADGHVRIQRGDVRARSGHAAFEFARNRTFLYDDPVAWDRDGEIRADTISLRMQQDRADLLEAFGSVAVDYRPRTTGERDIVLGDTLRADIEGGSLTTLRMLGNASSLYLPSLEEARRGTGRNVSSARRIHLYLEDGRAERVDFLEGARGVYRFPSQASLRTLRDPAALDSIFPDRTARALAGLDRLISAQADSLLGEAADSVSGAHPRPPRESDLPTPPSPEDTAESEPPDSLGRGDPLVEHFRATRGIDIPDSLQSPFDLLFDDEVVYSGDTIRFLVSEDRLSLRGSGKMQYGASALESEEIDYYSQRDLVVAIGSPTLSDRQSEVVGSRMTYRTDEEAGMVYQGRTEMDGGFYYGEEVKKLPDDALLVREGDYTTCDHIPPHYTFHSKKMKLIMKQSAVARPVVLRIYDVPVLGIPFYFFPLQSGRRSGLLVPDFEFGFNRNVGRYARNLGYYWAINDYMDMKGWIDFYDRGPELEFNGEYRYVVRYLMSGDASGSYLDQQSATGGAKRWKFAGSHVQNVGQNGRFTMRADFKSDATYVQDFDSDAGVDERLNRQLRSSATYSQNWSAAALSMSADRTQYLDPAAFGNQEVVERVPGISLTVNRFPLGRPADDLGRGGRLPFLASTTFSPNFRLQRERIKNFDGSFRDNSAAEVNWSLSDNRSVGPYLRLSPNVSGDVAWFRKDARGDFSQWGATWSSSLTASTTLYGTMPGTIGPLAGVRHVVKPSVSYNYQPDFPSLSFRDSTGVERSRFPSVAGISVSGSRVSSMSFALDQSFHTKWKSGETFIKKENVVSWTTSANYNFRARPGVRPLSALSNSVRFRPFSTFDASYSASIDPYEWTNEGYSATATVRITNTTFARRAVADTTGADRIEYGEYGQAELDTRDRIGGAGAPWTITANYNFSGGFGRKRSSLDLRSTIQPSANWSVSAGAYYDLEEGEFVSHSLSLGRDLHCWQFRFARDTAGGYRFNISIKDVPEVKYDTEKRGR